MEMKSKSRQKKAKIYRLTQEESAAYHEAGHTVVSVFLYLKFRKVTIVPEGDSFGCQSDRKYTNQFWDAMEGELSPYMLDRLGKIITVFFAGGIAQKIAIGRSNNVGSRSDWEKATDLASRIYELSSPKLRLYLKLKRMEAEDIVRLRWKEIQIVKDALLCRKTMTSREVRAVLFPELVK